MNLLEAAATAETFLRAWLAEHHPPPAPGSDDFLTVVQKVEPDGDDGLLATFGVSIAFSMSDLRPQRRIDRALRAMLAAHPALDPLRIEVTATTLAPDTA
jgi:hypothetical protein